MTLDMKHKVGHEVEKSIFYLLQDECIYIELHKSIMI